MLIGCKNNYLCFLIIFSTSRMANQRTLFKILLQLKMLAVNIHLLGVSQNDVLTLNLQHQENVEMFCQK